MHKLEKAICSRPTRVESRPPSRFRADVFYSPEFLPDAPRGPAHASASFRLATARRRVRLLPADVIASPRHAGPARRDPVPSFERGFPMHLFSRQKIGLTTGLITLLLALPATRLHAHGFEGDRFFPPTVSNRRSLCHGRILRRRFRASTTRPAPTARQDPRARRQSANSTRRSSRSSPSAFPAPTSTWKPQGHRTRPAQEGFDNVSVRPEIPALGERAARVDLVAGRRGRPRRHRQQARSGVDAFSDLHPDALLRQGLRRSAGRR